MKKPKANAKTSEEKKEATMQNITKDANNKCKYVQMKKRSITAKNSKQLHPTNVPLKTNITYRTEN